MRFVKYRVNRWSLLLFRKNVVSSCMDAYFQQPRGLVGFLYGSNSPVPAGSGFKLQLMGLVMLVMNPYAFQQLMSAVLLSLLDSVVTVMFWRTTFLHGTCSLHLMSTAIIEDDLPVMLAIIISEIATADVCRKFP